MSKAMPWMKFCPNHWRGDLALHSCSAAARGVWIELLCIAHEAEPYGHVLVNGVVPSIDQLAGLVNVKPREMRALLNELLEKKVAEISENGAVFSRRMVRDKAKRDQDIENGKGGGNPALKHQDASGKKDAAKQIGLSDGLTQAIKLRVLDTESEDTKANALAGPEPGEDPPIVADGLWDRGVAILAKTGVQPRRARECLGRWAKLHGRDAVTIAIDRAEIENPAEPVAFFERLLTSVQNGQTEITSARNSNRLGLHDALDAALAQRRAAEPVEAQIGA